jgi:signal peptidase II
VVILRIIYNKNYLYCFLFYLTALSCFFIDFFSKIFFVNRENYNFKVFNFFSLLYIKNTGASFGILKNNLLFLILIAIFITITIILSFHSIIFKLMEFEQKSNKHNQKDLIFNRFLKVTNYLFDKFNFDIKLIKKKLFLICLSLSLILGGTIGNLFDRLYRGFVVDFLYFYFKAYSFPIFNFADVFIFIGTTILIILMISNNFFEKK